MNTTRRDSFGSTASRRTLGNGHFWAMRVIRSDFGIVVVFEADGAGAHVLVFESLTGKVELTEYPADWQKLTDAELILLSYRSVGRP